MTLRLLPLLAPLLAATAASGDSIVLLDSVRLIESDGTILLSDIAELHGDYALQLGAIEIGAIEPGASGPVEFRITDVRRLLDEHGVHWGRLELSGQRVAVLAQSDQYGRAPLAMQPLDTVAIDRTSAPDRRMERTMAVAVFEQSTLRGWLARKVAAILEVEAELLQLDYPKDRSELLDAPLQGKRFEAKLLNSPRQSNRLEFEIRQWNDGTPSNRDLISIEPTVRTDIARLRIDVPRGRPILPEHIESVQQWMSPLQRQGCVAPESIDGRTAAVRLRAGAMLRNRDLTQTMLVKRGDDVRVSCFIGGAVMTLRATAESSGAAGDTITLRKGRERTTFTARITAHGEAVLALDGSIPTTVADASSGATP